MEINRRLRKETAQMVQVSEDDVEQVIGFQWRYIHESTRGPNTNLRIPKLGSFQIRYGALNEKRKLCEMLKETWSTELLQEDLTLPEIKTLLVKLDNNEEKLQEIYKKLLKNSRGIPESDIPHQDNSTDS